MLWVGTEGARLIGKEPPGFQKNQADQDYGSQPVSVAVGYFEGQGKGKTGAATETGSEPCFEGIGHGLQEAVGKIDSAP